MYGGVDARGQEKTARWSSIKLERRTDTQIRKILGCTIWTYALLEDALSGGARAREHDYLAQVHIARLMPHMTPFCRSGLGI